MLTAGRGGARQWQATAAMGALVVLCVLAVMMQEGGLLGPATGSAATVFTLVIDCPDGQERALVIPSTADAVTITETVASASGIPIAEVVMLDSNGIPITPQIIVKTASGDIRAKIEQNVVCSEAPVLRPEAPASKVAHPGVAAMPRRAPAGLPERKESDAVVTKQITSSLPRVIVATIGTGANVNSAVKAMESAYQHFGLDCIPSFHVLTDDPDSVDSLFNPKRAMIRERSHRDVYHFRDILLGLEQVIKQADYFIFVDPFVLFTEEVSLSELSGDLFGVEHPEYPRDGLGRCQPRTRDGRVRGVDKQVCAYPFNRNSKSAANIPEEVGKWIRKGKKKHHDGHNQVHQISSAWYLHSGLWGGKSKFVLELLAKAAADVDGDIASDVSAGIAEAYLNKQMWLRSSRSDINMRIHGNSFMYPTVGTPGDWITKQQTAKISYTSGLLCGTSNCPTKFEYQ